MQKKEVSAYIYTVENFMSEEECQHWIQLGEMEGFEKAKINLGTRQVLAPGVRNNDRVIYDDETLTLDLWERIKPFVPQELEYGYACGLNERLRFYRYTIGQEFKMHRDGSHIKNIHEWSSYTFMVYLNDGMEGGETLFPNSGTSIQPKTGMALLFAHQLLHQGCPITKGVKYVLRTDVMYRRKGK